MNPVEITATFSLSNTTINPIVASVHTNDMYHKAQPQDNLSLVGTIRPKLTNLLSIVVVTDILKMKLCLFMRRGYFARKS